MFFYGVDATKKPTAAPLGADNTYRSPFLCPQEESDLRAFFRRWRIRTRPAVRRAAGSIMMDRRARMPRLLLRQGPRPQDGPRRRCSDRAGPLRPLRPLR